MPTKDSPTYLFLGEEDFLKEQSIENLKSRFLDTETKDLNYSVFYGRDKNFNIKEMLDNLNTLPFLSKRRLVVLKEADSLPAPLRQSILLYLRNPKHSSVFIIESPTPAIKGEFLLEASRLAQLAYYRRLTDSGLNTWLREKAASSGKKISLEAVREIKENLPNNLRIFSSNMDNIILYIGKEPLITREAVRKVIGISPSHTAFDLIGSIEKRDAKRALCIFSSLKRDRKKETELLGLLAWWARMLLRIKELLSIKQTSEIRRDLALSPRVFDQIVKYASGFRKNEILNLLDEILGADLDIKTGMPPRLAIEKLIVKMCA